MPVAIADAFSDILQINTQNTDPLNPDTDGGGTSDGVEVANGTDPVTDTTDDAAPLDLDSDNDGIPNLVEGTGDSDADGIADALDLDSDNDGIPDITEAGGSDADNNGTVDNPVDENNDGLDDAIELLPLPVADQDGDGIANYLDADSDQDGLSDLFEAGGTDSDDNGIVDDFTDANGDGWSDAIAASPLPLTDSDNDGTPNYLDLDSDNDGLFDLVEAGGTDADNDGLFDSFLDSDGDGIPNQADVDATGGEDTDNDGIDDSVDASITLGDDFNQNGIDDIIEADVDGDGFATDVLSTATLPDSNNNGTPDLIEADADTTLAFVTGVAGGAGCSIVDGKPSKFDPLLALVALASTAILRRRSSEVKAKKTAD